MCNLKVLLFLGKTNVDLVYSCIICVELNYFKIYDFVQVIKNKGIAQTLSTWQSLRILMQINRRN